MGPRLSQRNCAFNNVLLLLDLAKCHLEVYGELSYSAFLDECQVLTDKDILVSRTRRTDLPCLGIIFLNLVMGGMSCNCSASKAAWKLYLQKQRQAPRPGQEVQSFEIYRQFLTLQPQRSSDNKAVHISY